ncbi:MAG: hypothetical protein RXR06_09560 [Thermoproteus sp.]
MALQFGLPILQRGTLILRPIGAPPPGVPAPPGLQLNPLGLGLGAGLAGVKTLVSIYPSNYDAVKRAIDDVVAQLRSRCNQVVQNCNVKLDVLNVSDLQGATTNIYTAGWRISAAPAQSVDVLKFTVPSNMAIGIGGFAVFAKTSPAPFDIYKINIYGDLQGTNKLYTAVTYSSAYVEQSAGGGVAVAYVPTIPLVFTPGSNIYINVELDPDYLKSLGNATSFSTLLMPLPLAKLVPA